SYGAAVAPTGNRVTRVTHMTSPWRARGLVDVTGGAVQPALTRREPRRQPPGPSQGIKVLASGLKGCDPKERRCDPKGDMTQRSDLFDFKASALGDDDAWHRNQADFGSSADFDGEQLEREERAAMRRVPGLSTELEDVTEVEYRQLRLERVVLCGVWTEGTIADADNSIRELAALAETAGSTVLAGLIQRRQRPDTGTF